MTGRQGGREGGREEGGKDGPCVEHPKKRTVSVIATGGELRLTGWIALGQTGLYHVISGQG